MVKIALVSTDIDRGLDVVKALERANIKVNAALWAVLPEYEDWRMVVASRQFDKLDFRGAHRLLGDALAPAGLTVYNTPTIMILPMSDSTIKDLRRQFAKAGNVEGMRPGGQMLGNRLLKTGTSTASPNSP
jgi:hypothetical protein